MANQTTPKTVKLLTVACCLSLVGFVRLTHADVLVPGYKSVKHQLVFEHSDAFDEHRLIAAPIRGFSGVEIVKPGEPFRFSSKYGTRFYLPEGNPIPDFDHEQFQQWPSTEPPIAEIKMVLITSSVASALTTLRFVGVNESGPMIEVSKHVELDRFGNQASATRSILTFGLTVAAGVALCRFAIRRRRAKVAREALTESA